MEKKESQNFGIRVGIVQEKILENGFITLLLHLGMREYFMK